MSNPDDQNFSVEKTWRRPWWLSALRQTASFGSRGGDHGHDNGDDDDNHHDDDNDDYDDKHDDDDDDDNVHDNINLCQVQNGERATWRVPV